ncbi:hypothetical protein J6590_029852 [Homalodisca vitripennis]|nr:hypothetical protein J6590_029852 [Homalodisca vitripennis]
MKAQMDPADRHLADEYVEEFVLDHLEAVSVKRETNNNNTEEDTRDMRPQRLPPMPICGGSVLPSPPQLLTPPAHQAEDHHHFNHNHNHGHGAVYHQQQFSQNVVHHIQHHAQNMVVHTQNGVVVSAIKHQNSLVMYPNTPGTPPDTPPISISPNVSASPPSHFHIGQPHSHIQHVHHGKPPGGLMEDMVWLTQSLRQEPLDLRPNCNEIEDAQSWPVQHPTINHKRMPQEYLQQHEEDMCVLRPVSVSSGVTSPLSGSGRLHHHGGEPDIISDDLLTHLTVRELNKRLHGLPREDVVRLKQKRRTLKNRGYAQNCRSKRLVQRHELELNNRQLQGEIHRLQMEVNRLCHDRDMYKHRYEVLQGQLRVDGSDGVPSAGHSNPSSPELF